MSIRSGEIELDVRGSPAKAYLAAPANGGPGVLVLHAWWGLKPFFKQVCDRLAEHGFTALAPDLFQGEIARTIEEAEALLQKHEKSSFDVMQGTVAAAKQRLVSLAPGKLGTIGFSMGAAWALIVAASEPDIAAVALFYGTGSVDFSSIKAQILGHFAEKDEWEPLEGVQQVEKDLRDHGLDVTFYIYPGASHWFVEEDRPQYDPASAQLAWERTYEFLDQILK